VALSTDEDLPGGWRVERFVDARLLALRQRPQQAWREAGRAAAVLLFAVVVGLALLLNTPPGELRWVTGPVVALLGALAAVALLALVRGVRRAATGLGLVLDAEGAIVRGFALPTGAQFGAGEVRRPLAAVREVQVVVHRKAGPDRDSQRAYAAVRVLLDDGAALEGPDAWSPDAAWEEARDRLLPVARALAEVAGKALVVSVQPEGVAAPVEPSAR
jgi:hypothetical protein